MTPVHQGSRERHPSGSSRVGLKGADVRPMNVSLPSTLESLLAPQARYDRLRQRHILAAGRQLADLAYANFWDSPASAIVDALRDELTTDRKLQLQYTPYGGLPPARAALADALQTSHGLPYTWRHLLLTPGAMAALHLTFRALCHPGDEVILCRPCWLDYPVYLAEQGITPVFVDVSPHTQRVDLDALEQAFSPKTRALVLTQPGNPTGLLHDDDDLASIASLLTDTSHRYGNRIALISDECHRDVIFSPHLFSSPAQFYDDTFVIYSLGKRLGIQGQRIGYVAIPPQVPDDDILIDVFTKRIRAAGFCTPTALMQRAVAKLIQIPLDLTPIARRREMATRSLRKIGYEVHENEATFFLYPKTPIADDFAFAEGLARLGTFVLPAPVFHHRGHFRISLTASDEMLERALPALSQAFTTGSS
jgi:aspartate aminotransferase